MGTERFLTTLGPTPWVDLTHVSCGGGADPTGVRDSTPAFNYYTNYAAARALGGIETAIPPFLPPGLYRVDGTTLAAVQAGNFWAIHFGGARVTDGVTVAPVFASFFPPVIYTNTLAAVTQSIPDTNFVQPTWSNVPTLNAGGAFNPATPTFLTAPSSGLYAVTSCIVWDANNAGIRVTSIGALGVAYSESEQIRPIAVAGVETVQEVAHTRRYTQGQQIATTIQQTSGGALNINQTGSATFGSQQTRIRVVKLSAG